MIESCGKYIKENSIEQELLLKKILIEESLYFENSNLTVGVNNVIDETDNGVTVIRENRSKHFHRSNFVVTANDFIKSLICLSKGSQKICIFVLDNLEPNCNYIRLTMNKLLSITEYTSEKKVYNALRELSNNKIMYKSKTSIYKDTFVINHNYIYKGSYDLFVYKYRQQYHLDNTDFVKTVDFSDLNI